MSINRLPVLLQNYYGVMSSSEHGDSVPSAPVTPTMVHLFIGMMPRPGQPGALSFDGTGVSDFLKDWNNECEEYGLTDAQQV